MKTKMKTTDVEVELKWNVVTINNRRFVLPESWSWDYTEGYALTASANDGDELVDESGEVRYGNPNWVPNGVLLSVKEANTYYNTLHAKVT